MLVFVILYIGKYLPCTKDNIHADIYTVTQEAFVCDKQ